MTASPSIHVDDLTPLRGLVAAAPAAEQVHPIGLREVVTGAGAILGLADLLARLTVPAGAPVAVLSDDVRKPCNDADVLDVVTDVLAAEFDVRRVVVRPHDGEALVHADEATVVDAIRAVRATTPTVLVSVGSGTIADLGKTIAHHVDVPHVIVQTAASVNGFADDHSVLLINGTKRTTPSRWPDALVIDTDVVAAAPLAMTRSGLGDQLSMFTAAPDWYLASAVGIDGSFSSTALSILRSGVPEVLAGADRLGANDPAAVGTLATALTRGGLAMGVAGRTAPSSGAEHTISHLLDMRAAAEGRPALPHGAQVGAATVVAAAVWDSMRERLRTGRCKVTPLEPGELAGRVRAAFLPLDPTGAVAQECYSSYARKLDWINEHIDDLQAVCDDWAMHDGRVADLVTDSATLASTLRRAGAAARFADLDGAPEPEVARWALTHCHLMRDRFTIVDLAEITGAWTAQDVELIWSGTQGPS